MVADALIWLCPELWRTLIFIIATYSRAPRKGLPRACPLDTNHLDPRGGAWPRGRPDEFCMPNKTLLARMATYRVSSGSAICSEDHRSLGSASARIGAKSAVSQFPRTQ
jgi:hypothetical protein